MSTTREEAVPVETGMEPEFFITDIVRCEPATDGTLRVFVGCSRAGRIVVQFTVVGGMLDFVKMARQVADMATAQLAAPYESGLSLKPH